MKKSMFLLLTTVVMAGCSPQVTSEMVTSGYNPVATNKVMIVESIDKVEKAQAIGQVTVDGKAESVGNGRQRDSTKRRQRAGDGL